MRPSSLVLSPVLALSLLLGVAHAGDIRIRLPKRTKATPVQKYNQDGVKALRKGKLNDARKLFYKAYLLDPDDPFTLNNLGYISELNGDIERAQRYYELAADNTSDATIDRTSLEDFKGKKVSEVAGRAADTQMQVNRYNVQAMGLLMKDRAPEADLLLAKALELDRRNPFTLNNLGFAKEKEGEYEQALTYYSKAANTTSDQKVIVAVNKNWRGKRISEIAGENVNKLRKLMEKEDSPELKVARLNLEGVSAMNRNDRAAARKYFESAYKISPHDAFTLNNMGYVSEMDGDRETADFYYSKAQEASRNKAIAAVATRKDVEGKPVRDVAAFGDTMIATRMEAERAERAREGGPVLLKKRDGSVVAEPDKAPPPLDDMSAPPSNPRSNEVMQPLPDNQQPAPQSQPSGDVMPPLPDNAQPNGQPANNGQPAANPGGVLQPLPDDQQPPAAQPNSQPDSGGVIQPLPDNQQPPAAQPNGGQQTNPPATQPKPSTPKASTSNQGAVVDGVIQPLPGDQQPNTKKTDSKTKPKQN